MERLAAAVLPSALKVVSLGSLGHCAVQQQPAPAFHTPRAMQH